MRSETRFLDEQGRLQQWPSKQADQLLVLAYLATKFGLDGTYQESEVNEILKQWHTFGDWPLLRRELYDRGFFNRDLNGSNYRLTQIPTDLATLFLVLPNIANDPETAVPWLAGETGRDTLRLMGNTESDNHPSTVEEEERRVREFVTSTEQRTWMLNYVRKTVGAIWLDLKASQYVRAPSVHIMIGDANARGKGVGLAAVKAVISLLQLEDNHSTLYSRYLTSNVGSAQLLAKLGFVPDGEVYRDADGLEFQNVKYSLDASRQAAH